MKAEFEFGNTRGVRQGVDPAEMVSADWGGEANFGDTVRPVAIGTKVFGRFTLIRTLGQGGMGIVWLAKDERNQREVALKFIPELVRMDETAVAELRRETKRGMQMNHAHIVRVYDFMEDESRVAIVMEYIEGGTLAKLLTQQPAGVFEVSTLKDLVMQLLDVLEYTHGSLELYHRDLKPANLMISADRGLKVADFGIACSLRDSASRVSVKQQAAGTLLYMSPQQLMGESPTAADDLYAVGATVYELLTGKPPFHGGDLTLQIQTKIAPSITARRLEYKIEGAAIPAAWETAISACLAKDASGRPRDIASLRDALNGKSFSYGQLPASHQRIIQPRMSSFGGVTTASQPDRVSKLTTWSIKRKVLVGAALVALAIVAAVSFFWGDGSSTVPQEAEVTDKLRAEAEAAMVAMKKRFEEVKQATAEQSINQNAREWRKFYEEIRGVSTIYSTEDDELKSRVKKLAESAEPPS